MKKRVLSLCMAFVLSFSMMPMTAFAQGTDAVTEQEAQSSENAADAYAMDEDISGGNAGTQGVEKTTAVQAVQNGEHIHPVCGTICTDVNGHSDVIWTATSTLASGMPTGNYYLTADVTLDATWTPANGTVLDLNGHSITGTGNFEVIIVETSNTFTLTDCNGSNGRHYFKNDTNEDRWVPCAENDEGSFCVEGGVITHSTDCKARGVSAGKAFTMYGGTICGNKYDFGAGVFVGAQCNFWMHGGAIRGNTAEKSWGGGVYVFWGGFTMTGGTISANRAVNGGGVYAEINDEKGSFTMSGNAEISGNTATEDGGGVYAKSGTFTMTDGIISDNIAGSCAGGVYLSGDGGYPTFKLSGTPAVSGNKTADTRENNVYLPYGHKITVYGALNGSAKIGVTSKQVPNTEKPVVPIATATDNWINAGNFTADNSLYKVTVSDDGKTANLEWHDHRWGVRMKNGETSILEECCTVEGCDNTSGGMLTLTAPDQKYNGASYNSAKCEMSGSWGHTPTVGEFFYTDSVGNKIDAPVNVGTYNVNVDVDGVTVTKEFNISAGDLTAGDFEYKAPDNLTYDGRMKEATVTSTKSGVGQITVLYYDEDDKQITKPTDAGIYTVKINVTAGERYNEVSDLEDPAWTFTIVKKPVTISGISVQDKVYNGNTDAIITGKAVIDGLVDGDENAVTVDDAKAKATFGNADAGMGKTVTFTGYGLAGAKAGNYILSVQPHSVTANIDPKELNIADVTVKKKTYDGTTEAIIADVTFNGLVNNESLTRDTDYTVTGTFVDAAVGTGKDVTATVKLADSVKNYTLSGAEHKKSGSEILKATVADPASLDFMIINGAATTYTVKLPELLPSLESPREYGNCVYSGPQLTISNNNYEGTATIRNDGTLALAITATGDTEGNIGTIMVKVETDNYTPITLTFNIKATAKIVPKLDGTLTLNPAEITYGEKLESIIISGTMKAGVTEIPGRFTWQDPATVLTVGMHNDVTWKFTPTNSTFYAETTGVTTVKVNKATPTGAPKYTLITTEGKTLADAGLTLTDSTLNPIDGTLKWVDEAGNALPDDTVVDVNKTYRWRFTPTDTNYNPLSGDIELYHVDAPAISAQPESVSVITGERATFEVTATGTDVTYQWRIDRNDGNGFVDITDATGATYTTGVTDKGCDGFKYQCVISNAAGSVTTDTVVLTVKEKYAITATAGEHGSISPSGTVEVVEGSNQTFTITAEEGYEIESLTVDGTVVNAVADYIFENVTAAHTIAVTFKLQYKIIDGANSSWTQSTDGSGSIRIRGNGEISKFRNVKVDGTIVDPINYIVTEGSTIIELKADYLKTLAEGTHTFEIVWTDGTASTSFTVAKNTSDEPENDDNNKDDNNDNNGNDNSNDSSNNGSNNTAGNDNTVQILTGSPNTGDASGIWITLFVVSAAGLAVMLVRKKNNIKK